WDGGGDQGPPGARPARARDVAVHGRRRQRPARRGAAVPLLDPAALGVGARCAGGPRRSVAGGAPALSVVGELGVGAVAAFRRAREPRGGRGGRRGAAVARSRPRRSRVAVTRRGAPPRARPSPRPDRHRATAAERAHRVPPRSLLTPLPLRHPATLAA